MKITIEDLSFRYKSPGAGTEPILKDINLEISTGSFVAFVGASGSGKTTLMQHFTGLLTPDSGCVRIDGQDIAKLRHLSEIRCRIGLLFQFPETQLFAETVYDDVAFGPRNLGAEESEVAVRVNTALTSIGLDPAEFCRRSPFHLSEGEKRRVAMAGVLALRPECLVLDEPTAGMDPRGVAALMQILKSLHAKGTTVVMISHDLELVATVAERIVILQHGRVLFDGRRESLLAQSDVLDRAGLEIPRAAWIARCLANEGLVATEALFTVQEIKQELRRNYLAGRPAGKHAQSLPDPVVK